MNEKVKMHISVKGRIRVNNAIMYKKNPDVIAIVVDLHSKYPVLSATGSDEKNIPLILLEAGKGTLYTRESKQTLTEITFPDYVGWDVWSASCSKYSVHICLLRNEHYFKSLKQRRLHFIKNVIYKSINKGGIR